ncbi:MAG: hypothetical protein AAGF12_32220 [Myxococcota bacterium]
MPTVAWGPDHRGVRFGLRPPASEMEAGGSIVVELLCENRSRSPVRVFGFENSYPRSLRVSPPKAHRPHIEVSFGDRNVLHPSEAFTTVLQGGVVSTGLDLSFAFDRRGAGHWSMSFAYYPLRTGPGVDPFAAPEEGLETPVIDLVVTRAHSLRDAGIGPMEEAALDEALLRGDGSIGPSLERFGPGGRAYLVRRIARMSSSGTETAAGFRALEVLTRLGTDGLEACDQALAELPHGESALRYARDWIAHRLGRPPPDDKLRFITQLDRLVQERDARGNFVLGWTPFDSAIHGTRRIEVFGDRERIVTDRAPYEDVAKTRRTRVTDLQLDSLMQSLRYAGVWLLRPLRPRGLPDEPRPTLEVQLGLGDPFSHEVALWNGEWRQGPGANLADLLDRLANEAASRATFPAPPR